MTTTGLSSRMAETVRPLAVYGSHGMTTLRPGTWASQASRLWLCWAAAPRPAPEAVVMVSGTDSAPPNMYFILAAWLTIWSRQTPMKSMNMRSTTGRRPRAAAPTPRPTRAASEIGVSIMRRGPNSSSRLSNMRNTPPYPATSSPATKTFSSSRMAWASPSLKALT